ncbi:MAG: adenylyl-sulfate kinase [Thermodesulfobacteriota bacterium]
MARKPEDKIALFPFQSLVGPADRELKYGHSRGLIWLTGLSGSGKSTLAHAVEACLHEMGVHCFVLDGDNVRRGLNRDLGLSPEDRRENIRRTAEVARLMLDAGLLVFSAFITPYEESRCFIRERMAGLPYYECYVRCSLDECERRDPKGLYRGAREGRVRGLTGLDAAYEEPHRPDLVIETDRLNLEESVQAVLGFLSDKKLIRHQG